MKDSLFDINNQIGIVVVSCDEKTFGVILSVNSELLYLTDHKEEALVGNNVAAIIPLSIGHHKHNEIMKNFFCKKSTTSVINRKVKLWIRT